MIFSALDITQSSLNEYFRNRYNQTEDKVIMSTLVNQDGSVGIPESDKIVMTLVNVQEERVTANRNSSKGGADPVHLYLYVLFSSYFVENNYGESLKFLSGVISFFQSHKILNHQNTPDLDSGIDKLSFEIYNQDLQNMSHLWLSLIHI